jgi:hypothetical protein
MAHLWVKDGSKQWAVLPLVARAYALTGNIPEPAPVPQDARAWETSAILIGADTARDDTWVLIAGRDMEVRVNGAPVRTGIHVLVDRDEIRISDAAAFFFSTEKLAAIKEYPSTGSPAYCPRCKQALEEGQPSVRCPQCGIFYHQSENLPCWTYSETCVLCPQSTDMSAGYRWTPEEL